MSSHLKTEKEIIDDLKILFESSSGRIGIGDDAAVIDHRQLISTDAIVEGVHFLKDKASWDDIAYKLFASNASDIAAMGGEVLGYTLTLSLPSYWTNDHLRSFVSGIRVFLKEHPADLWGGDTVHSQEFFASVTVLGRTSTDPWLRTGAKEGDFIYCTGTLGDSRLGLLQELEEIYLPLKNPVYFKQRHYRPTPRNAWVSSLKKYPITAAMDISDGLIEDLQKLSQSSQLGFYIDSNALPLSEKEIGSDNLQEHRMYYQKEALIGGEDYELVFTSPVSIPQEELLLEGIKVTRIGRMLSPRDNSFILYNGTRTSPKEFKGYEH